MSDIINLGAELLDEMAANDRDIDRLRLAQLNTLPIRFSDLKRMGQSPAHYAYAASESTRSTEVGSAADILVLGGTVLAYPGATRRGKEWEAWRDAQDPAALIVTKSELADAQGIAKAVHNHPEAMRLLDGVLRETMTWTLNGRACRGTPDARGANHLADLKTSETSDPRRFPWKVRDWSYHGQMAWYQDGAEAAGYSRPESVYLIAVEQKPPHVVTLFRLSENVLDLGRRLCSLWFNQLMACEASGQFPGYSQSVVELDLPEADDYVLTDAE